MGDRIALGIEPVEVEQWLKDLKRERGFANPTLDKTRRVMSMIYKLLGAPIMRFLYDETRTARTCQRR